MDPIFSVIGHQHDVFTLENRGGRLSDEIDNFKTTESNSAAESLSMVISKIVSEPVSKDLLVSLRSGTILCRLIEACAPEVHLGKWHKNPHGIVAFETENVHFFSKACLELGIHQSCTINYNVFVNSDIHLLITCLINLFKIIYAESEFDQPNSLVIETAMIDMFVATGTLTKADCEVLRTQQANAHSEASEAIEEITEEITEEMTEEMIPLSLPLPEEEIDHTEANLAFAAFIEQEEKLLLVEMEKLQIQEQIRQKKERLERAEWIERMRHENGLVSSDEEDQLEQEVKEDTRRHTIFIQSMKKELSDLLTSVVKEVKQTQQTTSSSPSRPQQRVLTVTSEGITSLHSQAIAKLHSGVQQYAQETASRKKETQEQRERKSLSCQHENQREKERNDKLRKDRKEFEEHLRKEDAEKQRVEQMRRQKESNERKRRMERIQHEKEEDLKKKAEKKKQWQEEVKRIEIEERVRKEKKIQHRKGEVVRLPTDTKLPGKPGSPCSSETSSPPLSHRSPVLRREKR